MLEEKRCLYCNEVISRTWARGNRKYCTDSCKASFWYYKKYKAFYDERYKRQKREWAASDNGKRAGVSLSEWRKLPRDWR